MTEEELTRLLHIWCRRLRITPTWDVALEAVDDESWRKTGDIRIDCDDRKAVVMINTRNPRGANLEEVLVHELFHLKLWPLDQVTESLVTECFAEDGPARRFAMTQFMTSLEQTVEELAKCFLLEFGEDRELSFGRCRSVKPFDDLYDGLRNLE